MCDGGCAARPGRPGKGNFPIFRMNSREWKDSVKRYFYNYLIFNIYQFGTMYEIPMLPENLES